MDCHKCGKRGLQADWPEEVACEGCSKAVPDCICPPRPGYPIGQYAAAEPEPGMPATLLERLLPGGCILDVPAVPDAVWGDGEDLLWAVGQSLIIAGPDGTGKTTVAGNLIQARLGLGSGTVLGLPVTPGNRSVLVLAMDRPQQAMAALARLFTEANRDVLNARLRVWRGPPPQDLARDPSMLARLCALADADTCVVDSLKDAAIKLSDDEAGAGWNRARQLAIEGGTQLLELHHPRKAQGDNKKPRALDDLYGSRWIPAGAGSVISLWGQAGDPVVEMSHLKPVVAPCGPWQVTIHGESGRVTRGRDVDLLEQVRLRSGHGITAAIAAQLLFCAGDDKPSASQVERARRKLDAHVRATPPRLYRRDGQRGGASSERAVTTWFLADRSNHGKQSRPCFEASNHEANTEATPAA